MSTLYEKGLRLSKNAVFSYFVNRASKLLGTPFKVITALNEAADKLAVEGSKDNKFKQLFNAAFTLVRMVRHYISGDYREVSTGTIVSGLGVLLYVLSPIDLVPDFIPVVGFLDDLSLISWFVGKFQVELTKYRDWEATRRDDEAPATPDEAAEPARGNKDLPVAAELGHS